MSTTEKQATQPLMIGEILVQADIIQEHQLPRALQMAKDRSLRVGQVLVMMRYLSDQELEPILEIQKLINDGRISSEAAIEALRVMRRDGLPLIRAVEKVQAEPANRAEKMLEAAELKGKLSQLEGDPQIAARDTVPTILKIGDVKLELREFAEAEGFYKRGLAILETAHGQKSVKLLPTLGKILDLQMLQQRYKDAETICWRYVNINQEMYGPEHLQTAHAMHKLARVLDAQGRHSEAEQFLLSAIRVLEKHLGIEHPALKAALRHFSSFWKRMSRKTEYKRIGELLVDAEIISQDQLNNALQEAQKEGVPVGQKLVKTELITGEILRSGLQAQLLVQDGVIPAAVAARALKIASSRSCSLEDALDEMCWSPDPITTRDLQKLMGTADELMAAERALGPNHPGVAVIALKLGEQCMFARKFGNAESAYKRALHILRQCWGQNNIELASTMFKLASLYYVQKRYSESEAMHWQVLSIRKNALGAEHSDVVQSLDAIARVQDALGNVTMADQMRDAAEAIRTAKANAAAAPAPPSTVSRETDDVDSLASIMKPAPPPAKEEEAPKNLAFIDFPQLLRNLLESKKSGFLVLTNHRGKEVGKLSFNAGNLATIRYRHLKGSLALLDLVSREDPVDFSFSEEPVTDKIDATLAEKSLDEWLNEAARRADELPGLLEEVGWPRTCFVKVGRMLDTSTFSDAVAQVAADVWMFIEEDADNSQMIEGVYADRYTFLLTLREMQRAGVIQRSSKATGSFGRLNDIR